MEHCVTGSPEPHGEKEGELRKIGPIVDPLHISGMAEAMKRKFCVAIEGWGPSKNRHLKPV